MNKIFFVIGASGAGKTTAVKNLEKEYSDDFFFCYFDSTGVPPVEEMIEKCGSIEEWQRIKTQDWVKKIKDDFIKDKPTLLDAQARPSFIDEACKMYSITDYEVILFDCTDEERKRRLLDRGQPELADDNMMGWAKYLRGESIARNYRIIDNTNLTQEESRDTLLSILNGQGK